MPDIYVFTLNGTPISQARHRFTKSGFVYDPNSQQKKAVKDMIEVHWPFDILTGPVRVTMEFKFPFPKAWSQKKRAAVLKGDVRHVSKPDVDNLLKFYLDCMTGIVFKDDAQVFGQSAEKSYDDDGSTEIVVYS